MEVRAHAIGASGERWAEPFLQASEPSLQRLRLPADVCADSEVYVRLTPGARIGAVALVGLATRRVVAGMLVEPRFRWPALGAVFNSIGFTVEPALGGSPLVPGSARDVPPGRSTKLPGHNGGSDPCPLPNPGHADALLIREWRPGTPWWN